MIYEIVSTVKSLCDGIVIFKPTLDDWENDAWAAYTLLENASLHKNVRVGCFDGYENCIVFERNNFR